ncbi:SDR family oxidoreductase [Persicitalea jodogahamensis]|uniref:Oxidoreductase n=1 Tax=Persicitalea jodogahamensis TaxID=402147 RepID=A0A8J3D3U0_9BACT|nr:SDR family oxidoreductase [Persicitalea jodogahamensis]GHB52772.1 oxidoreductase [Persicitalea jodogahamensis]
MNPLAVITGGTKGIGRATAERFLAGGFDVVTCARQMDDLEEFREKAEARFPNVSLLIKQADLSLRNETADFVDYVDSLAQPVAVLVNNTGVFIPGQLHSEPEGILERSIETNVYSAYHITRGLLPKMTPEKAGHIFNICSTASLMAYPNGGSYAISKFALYGMTKGFREELKPFGIKVTAVLPGPTLTASWAGTDLPESRFMRAEDVAESIWSAYNLSPAAVIEEILMRPVAGDIS